MRTYPIKDQPGYLIDKEGNIYSAWKFGGPQKGYYISDKLKKLKGTTTKHGYISIQFGRGSKRRYVHQLMLETFVSERPEGKWALHKDDNPSNNKLKNLYWGTPKENMSDRRENNHMNEGSKHGASKFSDYDIMYIRSMRGKKTQKALSEEFNVHPNTIYYIQKKYTWKVVG